MRDLIIIGKNFSYLAVLKVLRSRLFSQEKYLINTLYTREESSYIVTSHDKFIPLFRPKTTISEIFAIMRQWVPQVQQNIEMLIKEVRESSYFSYINYLMQCGVMCPNYCGIFAQLIRPQGKNR